MPPTSSMKFAPWTKCQTCGIIIRLSFEINVYRNVFIGGAGGLLFAWNPANHPPLAHSQHSSNLSFTDGTSAACMQMIYRLYKWGLNIFLSNYNMKLKQWIHWMIQCQTVKTLETKTTIYFNITNRPHACKTSSSFSTIRRTHFPLL